MTSLQVAYELLFNNKQMSTWTPTHLVVLDGTHSHTTNTATTVATAATTTTTNDSDNKQKELQESKILYQKLPVA